MKTTLAEVYGRLYAAYGPQNWWPADSLFEVIVGAILSQSIAWINVQQALHNLKSAGVLSPQGLKEIALGDLAILLRPSGYFNVKAKKLKAFTEYFWEHYQGDIKRLIEQDVVSLRKGLLSVYGIGEETSDAIILYAADKPSFVIDSYTRRIVQRLDLVKNTATYREHQDYFQRTIPIDTKLYNEFHALMVRHGQQVCKRKPLCEKCCLLDICPWGIIKTGN